MIFLRTCLLSAIAMAGIARPGDAASLIAMLRIGPRLIYIDQGIGLNPRASNCDPQWAQTESLKEELMAWTTPSLVEICIGLEINGYLPAEF